MKTEAYCTLDYHKGARVHEGHRQMYKVMEYDAVSIDFKKLRMKNLEKYIEEVSIMLKDYMAKKMIFDLMVSGASILRNKGYVNEQYPHIDYPLHEKTSL